MLNDYSVMTPAQYQRMPWKNGLGETLEIMRLEDESGVRFRLSQAAVVENGAFSFFDGLQRTLVMLSGNGVALSCETEADDKTQHVLSHALEQASFSGAATTYATLADGPIEDLNIMVRKADTSASVVSYRSPTLLKSETNVALFVGGYAQSDCQLVINVSDRMPETVSLLQGHTLHMLVDAELKLLSGDVVWVTVTSQP